MENFYQVAIVTGGASGIGRAISSELAKKQIFVVIADINEQGGKMTVDDIVKNGGKADFIKLDVTVGDQVEAIVHKVYREHGRLDYMFNNAGIAMYGELYNMSREHWEKIININLWGVIHGTQAAYPLMKKQGFGHIANTASAAGLGPSPTASAYSMTKHAVVGLTTSLHYEAEAFGVKVSALCPAFVDTPIFARGEAVNMSIEKINEQVQKQKMMTPMQFARIALKGLERNEPIISPVPLRRTMDIIFTLFPSAHRRLMRLVCNIARKANINSEVESSK